MHFQAFRVILRDYTEEVKRVVIKLSTGVSTTLVDFKIKFPLLISIRVFYPVPKSACIIIYHFLYSATPKT